jgi:hypothetical protein
VAERPERGLLRLAGALLITALEDALGSFGALLVEVGTQEAWHVR